MKRVILILSLITLSTTLTPTASAWGFGDQKEHTAFIISNAHSYNEEGKEVQQETVLFAFTEALADHKKSSKKNDTVSVILTADPDKLVFSGTLPDFFDQASRIYTKTGLQNRCNDLEMVYDQLAQYVTMNSIDRIRIVHIGGWVQADITCSDKTKITVPQEIDETLKLASILTNARAASFDAYLVRDEQVSELFTYLQTNGVADKKNVTVRIIRAEEMAQLLQNASGLGGGAQ